MNYNPTVIYFFEKKIIKSFCLLSHLVIYYLKKHIYIRIPKSGSTTIKTQLKKYGYKQILHSSQLPKNFLKKSILVSYLYMIFFLILI